MSTKIAALALLACAMSGYQANTKQGQPPDTVIPVQDEAPGKAHSYDWPRRHLAALDRIKQGHVDLVLIGDSITSMLGGDPKDGGGGPGNFLWDKYFGSRNAVNLGFGWDRTQHVLWRLENGEIDGIQPKVAVILIGTNNLGRNPVPEVVAGITAIVDKVHEKLPKSKILLLGIFPRGRAPGTSDRKSIAEVNAQVQHLQKRRYVTFLDLATVFLESDGTISSEMMGDYLHPTSKGDERWLEAMEPTLSRLMGDGQRFTPLPYKAPSK